MFYLIILMTVPVLFLLWEGEMAALTIIVVRLSTKHNPFLENSKNSAVHARQNMYLLYNIYVCV